MRLDDKTIVVTGSSAGLGRAMADAFVREGARVVYSSDEPADLQAATDGISAEVRGSDGTGEAIAVEADVRSWDAVRRLVRRTRESYGPIDVFVNNAGVLQYKVNADRRHHPVVDIPVSSWDAILDTNLRGTFLGSKAVLPGMLERDTGRVIHISSGHGRAGRATRAPYCTSKFGIEGFHESLALELEGSGVDSLVLRPPGGTYTESSALIDREPEDYEYEDPSIISPAAVALAAGAGDNGERYRATRDGYERDPR